MFCGNGMDRKDYFVGIFSAYFECYVVVSLDSIREAFKKNVQLGFCEYWGNPPTHSKEVWSSYGYLFGL